MNRILVIVLAHGSRQDLVDAHELFWLLPNPVDLIYFAPEDAPVSTKHRQVLVGHSGRYGPDMATRTKHCLREAAHSSGIDYLVLHEHDSVCLTAKIGLTNGVVGNYVASTEADKCQRHYGDPFPYLNAPWIIDHDSLVEMSNKADRFPAYIELGEIDRLVSGLARLCGIPLLNHAPPGYGDHTNSKCDISGSDRSLALAEEAVRRGATMIHGIKDAKLAMHLMRIRQSVFNEELTYGR